MATFYVGIDPDMHDTAVAWCDQHGNPVGGVMVKTRKVKGIVEGAAVIQMISQFAMTWPRIIQSEALLGNKLRICVEGQSLQRSGHRQHKNPQNIVNLGNVAGGIVGLVTAKAHGGVMFPPPEFWKGGKPKSVMQARLYTKLGWGYKRVGASSYDDSVATYAHPLGKTPPGFDGILRGQWKHMGDALLMARWIYQKDNEI